jgi:hypothetical protein
LANVAEEEVVTGDEDDMYLSPERRCSPEVVVMFGKKVEK